MASIDPRERPNTRRLYFASLFAAAVALILVRFLLFPNKSNLSTIESTTAQLLDGLISATIAAAAVGVGYVLFVLQDDKIKVEHLPAREIREELDRAARSSREWRIKARTASYFTRCLLPVLLNKNGSIQVKIQMLDPQIDSLMNQYAAFRSSHPDAALWSSDRVRHEICSSILLLAIYANRYPRLDVDIRLSSAFWVLSIDCTEDRIYICGQNKGDAALVFRKGTEFFEHFMDDFDATFALSRTIRPQINGFTLENLNRELTLANRIAVTNMYNALGFSTLSDADIDEIVQTARSKHHYN
ncbi:hypothetical protein [Nocardia fusca]|uniref:hypothetical protein n=1 Tax=Nocardia fusca TaxID=941183 RepID=UPI000ABB1BEE|nr:hypothetical protein [Nocardia fusca]